MIWLVVCLVVVGAAVAVAAAGNRVRREIPPLYRAVDELNNRPRLTLLRVRDQREVLRSRLDRDPN